MTISKEALKQASNIQFEAFPEKSVARDRDVIGTLNTILKRAGLPEAIKPLTVKIFSEQGKDNLTHTPKKLTPAQAASILYMAVGSESVEIGELKKPLNIPELGTGDMIRVTHFVTLERTVHGHSSDTTTGKYQGRVSGIVWEIYSVSKTGEVAHLGTQV